MTVLVHRRSVCDFDAPPARRGPLPPASGALRWGRPLLAPIASLHCFDTRDRVVALTYDDGPDPEQTPGVLDALAEYGVRATFLVLAEQARAHPDLVRRMVDGGHDVGLHGGDHTRLTTLPAREAVRRVLAARDEVAAIAGRPVRWFRPAYGAQSVGLLLGVRRAGLDVLLWSAWARDWEGGSSTEVAEHAAQAVHPGAVLLLHDGTAGPEVGGDADAVRPRGPLHRAGATALLLDHLADDGWTVGTVTDLAERYQAVRTVWFERGPAA